MDFQTIEKQMSDLEKEEFPEIVKPPKHHDFIDYLLLFVSCFIALLILFFAVDYFAKYFKSKPEMVFSQKKLSNNVETQTQLTKTFDLNVNFYPKDDDYSAKALLVYDLESNRTIFEKNADQKTFIASLTKMATTKIIADEYSLNEIRSINAESAKYNGSSLELKENQIFTMRDLLKAAVISSSNQSVYAMQDPAKSVKEMNEYAKTLRLKNTSFANPAGFDDDQNYSTADELIPIAKLFFMNDTLLEFSGTAKSDIYDISESKRLRVNTTNDLVKLGNEYVIGGKTGTTQLAAQNLVLLVEKNKRRYIIIILNSIERYKDAEKVLARI